MRHATIYRLRSEELSPVAQGPVPGLDGLRALAVLCVIFFHAEHTYVRGGNIGVQVFFALSGFLITSILLREYSDKGRISYRGFYVRRAARLGPALLIVLACASLYAFLVGGQLGHDSLTGAVAALLYVANWVWAAGHPLGVLAPTWSLAVEEQFYLLWPLCLTLILRRWGRGGVVVASLAGCVAALALRLLLWHGPSSAVRLHVGIDTNADQLLVGCATAAAWSPALVRMLRLACAPSAILLLLAVIHGVPPTWFWSTVGMSGVAGASALLVGAISDGRLAPLLSAKPLVWVGQISYGVYLWHYPLLLAIRRSAIGHGIAGDAIFLTATFAVATLSYYFLELPVRNKFRSALQRRDMDRAASPSTDSSVVGEPVVRV
jgi:peptidoglycan/LPS O-acetylase OafA/YrhL